jgi:hypothetical protein
VFHGFLRYPWGYFEPLDAPGAGKGAGQGTFALSVNLPGTTTTGVYVGADNVVHGFVLTPANTIESFDATKYTSFTFPCEETCVNPVGAITGYFLDSTNTQHGFVRSPSGNITTFDAPNAVTYTFAASINPRGVIAGYFGDQNGVPHGYVLFPNGSFSPPIDYPAAVGTAVLSINPSGKTTGEYFDANLVGHGFERDAQGHFINFSAEDAGTGQFQGTRPSTNNSSGEVTGWYISSDVNGNNVNHGFVWEPSAATQ